MAKKITRSLQAAGGMLFIAPNLLGAEQHLFDSLRACALAALLLAALFAVCGSSRKVFIVAAPAVILWPLEMWMRLDFNTPISSQLISIALGTNTSELLDFLLSYGPAIILPTIIGVGVWAFVWLKNRSEPVVWQDRSRWWICATLIGVVTIQYLGIEGTPNFASNAVKAPAMPDPTIEQTWLGEWRVVYPANILISGISFVREQRSFDKLASFILDKQISVHQIDAASSPDLVVLIIGESATSTHWSMHGYERNTTPNLSRQNNLFFFKNVTSLSVATRTAVPGVLSRKPILRPNDTIDENGEPSIVRIFREAGYLTAWISNQAPLGAYDSSIGIYALEAEKRIFVNPSDYTHHGQLDGAVLAPFSEILRRKGKKFIVVHLLGSHFNYASRYPSAFQHFISEQTFGADPRIALNDAYDNSIRYTDWVISRIISATEKSTPNSLVAYFSDHGVDEHSGVCGAKTPMRQTPSAFKVPMFFWAGADAIRFHSNEWAQMSKNLEAPYTTRAVFGTVLKLSGIGLDGEEHLETVLQRPKEKSQRDVVNFRNQTIDFDALRPECSASQ